MTPEGIEKPRCIMDPASAASVSQQPEEHRATLPEGPDAKWRFFWRIGSRPQHTQYPELNADPIIPAGNATRRPSEAAASCQSNLSEHIWLLKSKTSCTRRSGILGKAGRIANCILEQCPGPSQNVKAIHNNWLHLTTSLDPHAPS